MIERNFLYSFSIKWFLWYFNYPRDYRPASTQYYHSTPILHDYWEREYFYSCTLRGQSEHLKSHLKVKLWPKAGDVAQGWGTHLACTRAWAQSKHHKENKNIKQMAQINLADSNHELQHLLCGLHFIERHSNNNGRHFLDTGASSTCPSEFLPGDPHWGRHDGWPHTTDTEHTEVTELLHTTRLLTGRARRHAQAIWLSLHKPCAIQPHWKRTWSRHPCGGLELYSGAASILSDRWLQ